MSDYNQLKSVGLSKPTGNVDLGDNTHRYGNIFISGNVDVNGTVLSSVVAPRITQITYSGNDTATDPAGGSTVTLVGEGFLAGASVLIESTTVSVVTVVSSTEITFAAPALAVGSYILYVVNTDGGTGISVPGIQYSGTPAWTTAAGSLGTQYEQTSLSKTLVATGDAPVTFSLQSGTLPSGATLDSNAGTLTGTTPAAASSTTYNFTIRASDAQNQDTDRAFSLTISPDMVTWSSPTDGASITLDGTAYSNSLVATSAAGKTISYSANALPSGLTLDSGTISGTPTTEGTTSTLLTATADVTTRTATATITWVVSLGDSFWKNTTLLLSGNSPTTTFINDASLNNSQLTIVGDARPSNFNPNTPGYYSYKLDGASYILGTMATGVTIGTSNFCLEGWGYWSSFDYGQYGSPLISLLGASAGELMIRATKTSASTTTANWFSILGGSTYIPSAMYSSGVSGGTLYTNRWHHLAVQRVSGTWYFYIDGVLITSTSAGDASLTLPFTKYYIGNDSGNSGGYLAGNASNIRLTVGTVPYATAGFTVPTAPLISGSDTKFLSAQSNRLIDTSTSNATFTTSGTTQVQSASPFTLNSSYSTYGSAYFSATSAYSTVSMGSTQAFGTGDFTVECWLYMAGTTAANISMVGNTSLTWTLLTYGNQLFWQEGGANLGGVGYGTVPTSAWTHLAVSRTSGVLKMFVNGVQVYSAANTYNYSNSTTLRSVGPYDGGSAPFYLSDFRVINGTGSYTSAFTPTASPLTSTTNTQLLTYQYNGGANNNGFVDQSGFNNIITRTGNITQGTFSPYSQTGWSNYFDGSGDYLTVPASAQFDFGTGDYTIEGWIHSASTSWTLYATGGTGSSDQFSCDAGTLYWAYSLFTGVANFFTSADLNTWTHVAASRSSGTTRLFKNGIVMATSATSTAIGSSVNTLQIGRRSDGFYYTTGYMSNIRVIKGTALYTSTFTPSTSPLSAIIKTSLLTCQDNRLIDKSANNFTITKAGDVSVQAFSPFGGVTPMSNSYSMYFDGTGDNITVGSTAISLPTSTTPFTMEAWVYATAFTGISIISTNFSSGGIPFQLGLNNGTQTTAVTGGYLHMSFYSGSSWTYAAQSTSANSTALSLNTWYHVAGVYSGTTAKLFVNGVNTVSNNISSWQTTASSAGGINVGRNWDTSAPCYFSGYISNARLVIGTAVYTADFTPSTTPLTAIANTKFLTCQSATIVDNSTNYFAITAIGDTKVSTFNPFGTTNTRSISYTPAVNGGSMYFDGTGDNVYAPSIAKYSNQNHTIEFWAYFNNVSTRQSIINQGWNTGSYATDGGWTLDVGVSGPGLSFALGTMASGSFWIGGEGSGVSSFKVGQWHHIAIVRNGTNVTIYSNGLSVATGTLTNSGTLMSNMGFLRLGTYDNGTFPLNGYITDVRVSSGALYTSSFYPNSSPLTSTTTIGTANYPANLLLNGTSGGIIDYHGTNNLETVGNTQLAPEDPYSGSYYSNYFTASANIILTQPALGNIFTIEMWVYPTATPSNQYYYIGGSTTGPLIGYNSATFALAHQGGWSVTSSINPTVGQWNHIAVVREGTGTNQCKIYVNGVLGGTGTEATTFSAAQTGGTIGQAGSAVQGYISNLRITNNQALYTGAFTPATAPLTTSSVGTSGANVAASLTGTVLLLTCQSNKFIDNSASALSLTPSAVAVKSINPFQQNTGKSLYFDGTGDYLSTMQLASPNLDLVACDFTIEGWVYNASPGAERYILSQRGSSSGWELRINSTNLMQFFFTGGSTLTSTSVIPSNQWAFIAVTRSANSLKIYINGTLDATNASFTNGTSAASAYPVYIGNSTSAGGGLFLGYIKDLRITKGNARYTTTFTPPTAPLQIK